MRRLQVSAQPECGVGWYRQRLEVKWATDSHRDSHKNLPDHRLGFCVVTSNLALIEPVLEHPSAT